MRHFPRLNRVDCGILRTLRFSGLDPIGTKMAAYGYARVSTLDQDLTVQRRALRAH